MKDKYLKVRMTEEELKSLKSFTEEIGFKNTSETVRESLKTFTIIKEREPKDTDNLVKSCDASSILWASRFLCNEFDIQDYLTNDNSKSSEEFNQMLVNMYDEGSFDTLKECILKSIYHDLIFSNEVDDKVMNLIKDIAIEFLKKQ